MNVKRSCSPRPKIEEDCYDWYERHEDRCRLAAEKSHDLILIGDSITHFWETSLAPDLYRETFGKYSVLNLGFGWDRTPNVLWHLSHGEFENQKPKLLIMHIGTNNFGATANYPGGDSPEETADGIIEIVRLIHRLSPDTRILVMGIFQRGLNHDPFREKIRSVNQLLSVRVPDEANCMFLNISERFMLPDASELNSALFNDNCHPNPAGYQIWADAIRPYLEQFCPACDDESRIVVR